MIRPRRYSHEQELDWTRSDIETRCFFRGGRYTRVNSVFSGLFGLLMTGAFFTVLHVPQILETHLARVFLDRGPTQYVVAFLFFWSLAILLLKSFKLKLQRRCLDIRLVPTDPGFVISTKSVEDVLHRVREVADDPRQFVILNRIELALGNFNNLGRIGDVEDILRAQAAQDESQMDTSYAMLQGFVWAIPVLGFIGTVLGLSTAIGSFTGVLDTGEDLSAIITALGQVTGGLATAFDTTLVALVAALVVQMLVITSRKSEEEFLDDALEYCTRTVVARLRLAPRPTE